MKPLLRGILLLAAANLVTAGLAVEEESAEDSVTRIEQLVQRDKEVRNRMRHEVLPEGYEFDWEKLLDDMPFVKRTMSSGGVGRVLVIPEDEVDAAELMAVMEDMTIMARILDKKLEEEDLGKDYDWYSGGSFFEWTVPVTRGIYLGGYGAFFLRKVDFPLLGPAEAEEKKEEAEEEADPVWQKTKWEMYFGRDVSRAARSRRQRKAREYSDEKVEALKEVVLESLRHASNIRNLEAEDWIIVSTVSECGFGQVLKTSAVNINREEKIVTTAVEMGGTPGELSLSPAAVMTMRVRKSEVDSLAEGEIGFDEFSEKVETVFVPAGGYGGGSYPGGYGGGRYGGGGSRR
jgi:hypothetical protein